MPINVEGYSSLSSLFLLSITCISSSSTSFRRPWMKEEKFVYLAIMNIIDYLVDLDITGYLVDADSTVYLADVDRSVFCVNTDGTILLSDLDWNVSLVPTYHFNAGINVRGMDLREAVVV
jgi:hypothetical protein